jgi:hypothetical protein
MRAIIGPLMVVALLVTLWVLFFSGNPGGIPDARYAKFKAMAPPKLLYSCTRKPTREALLRQASECLQSGRSGCDQKAYESGETENEITVDFVGGAGTGTYDELLRDARRKCAENHGSIGDGKLTVLESHTD